MINLRQTSDWIQVHPPRHDEAGHFQTHLGEQQLDEMHTSQ
jgi:hypothetical protein